METKTTGGCLCGAVRYEITGKMRHIVNCHCSKCRRFHGHYGAYTRTLYSILQILLQKFLEKPL